MTTSGPSARTLREWATASLALVGLAVEALPDGGPDVGVSPLDREKVVGEALLLLRSTARILTGTEPPKVWHRVHDAVAPLARPESLGAVLCREPSRALENAFAHVQLSALGRSDPGIDTLLDLALTEPTGGPEPYVVAALHREWLSGLRADGPELTRLTALVERSSLGRPVDVLRCTTQDVYDLTHAVMHGTDLGSWVVASPRRADELLGDLDSLLGIALDADNLDLTAELLWSWPMLGLPRTPAARFASEVLVQAHHEHGFLPGPGFDASTHASLPAAEGEVYLVRTSYHATLVFGILCAATLVAGPAHDLPAAPTRSEPLLDPLAEGRRRRWQHVAGTTGVDDLGPMLLAIGLRRASDAGDLLAVRRFLELGLELDLTDGPAVRQSVALLRRSAALARHHEPALCA